MTSREEQEAVRARRRRFVVFALAVAALLPAFAHVALRMPRFGDHPLPYGEAINRLAPRERHVTNMVSAVNFDYRGFDTLGEEFMLLCAVTGVTVLLRGSRGETTQAPGTVPSRPVLPRSDATMLAGRLAAPPLGLFGLYIVLHATTTPGGGFQGGVLLATAGFLAWLAEGYGPWRRLVRSAWLHPLEGGGCAIFALCGLVPLLLGRGFLANILPHGTPKDMLSGGLMVLENAGVALAVTGGFGMLALEFLEETRAEAGKGS